MKLITLLIEEHNYLIACKFVVSWGFGEVEVDRLI
jgi:hypothetical protein